jgi:DNA-binding NarL/FixJ family response regulator
MFPAMAISVFVVDDHELVRKGIVQLLRLEKDVRVLGEGSGTLETFETVVRLQPNVAVVDLEMPQIRGADFIQSLKRRTSEIKVVACTMHSSRGYLSEALRAGAEGYVLKSSPSDWLVAGIRSVGAGKAYVDPTLQDEMVRLVQDRDSQAMQFDLTAQELEVLRLVADGLTNQEIAQQMHHSLESVKLRLRRSFQKLGANDRAHAVAVAVRRSLI